MAKPVEQKDQVIIRFAGDSGDGMQLTGDRFTSETAVFGNDIATFPDFPAEIRAPAGSLPGVSGFQVHFADDRTPIDETLQALDDVVRSGKVRYVGCSNFLAYQLALAVGRSDYLRVSRFESVQPRYNLLFREIERELLPLCKEQKIAVIPYNPLAGGFLTGKHNPGTPSEGTRFALEGDGTAGRYQERYWHDRMFETVEALRGIAKDAGMSMAQLAVAWQFTRSTITSPIIGASKPEQLADAVAALDTPLDADLTKRIDVLTREYRFGDSAR